MATSLGQECDGYVLISHRAEPSLGNYQKHDLGVDTVLLLVTNKGERIECTGQEHDSVVQDYLNSTVGVWAKN